MTETKRGKRRSEEIKAFSGKQKITYYSCLSRDEKMHLQTYIVPENGRGKKLSEIKTSS